MPKFEVENWERSERCIRRGNALMNSIEAHGPPASVHRIHRYKGVRGGVNGGAIFFGFLGLFFMMVGLGTLFMMTEGLINRVEGDVMWLLVMFVYLAFGFAAWLGYQISLANLPYIYTKPEDYEVKIWFDPKHAFLASIIHASVQKTGNQRKPELLDACFVTSSDVVSVATGFLGADSQGDHPWSSVVVSCGDPVAFEIQDKIWDDDADALARAMSRRIGVQYEPR